MYLLTNVYIFKVCFGVMLGTSLGPNEGQISPFRIVVIFKVKFLTLRIPKRLTKDHSLD